MSQKSLTDKDLKEYEKVLQTNLNKLVTLKNKTEVDKKELIIRIIEVSEPLVMNGRFDGVEKPDQLCSKLWEKFIHLGIDGFVSQRTLERYCPDHLKRKHSETDTVDSNFLKIDETSKGNIIEKSLDGKYYKINGILTQVIDIKQQEEKAVKESARTLLNQELKESVVVDCIRTSEEFLDQFKSFLNKMEEKFRENPQILEDFEKTLDWEDLHDMCIKLKSLYNGEGSIIRQMHMETNFRAPATILQLALAKTLGALDTYRNWAHKLSVSPRQYQRIRERLGEWPEKKASSIIEKSLGSFMCPQCKFNLISHKKHPKYDVVNTKSESKEFLEVYLGGNYLKVPKEFSKYGATPIQVCEKLFLGKLRGNSK